MNGSRFDGWKPLALMAALVISALFAPMSARLPSGSVGAAGSAALIAGENGVRRKSSAPGLTAFVSSCWK